jgi:hypothetical protein
VKCLYLHSIKIITGGLTVRVLEALKILEDAVVDCKKRDIDTLEVREALNRLEPFCSHKWQVEGFRNNLRSAVVRSGTALEGATASPARLFCRHGARLLVRKFLASVSPSFARF